MASRGENAQAAVPGGVLTQNRAGDGAVSDFVKAVGGEACRQRSSSASPRTANRGDADRSKHSRGEPRSNRGKSAAGRGKPKSNRGKSAASRGNEVPKWGQLGWKPSLMESTEVNLAGNRVRWLPPRSVWLETEPAQNARGQSLAALSQRRRGPGAEKIAKKKSLTYSTRRHKDRLPYRIVDKHGSTGLSGIIAKCSRRIAKSAVQADGFGNPSGAFPAEVG